jgi:hypothetical protein
VVDVGGEVVAGDGAGDGDGDEDNIRVVYFTDCSVLPGSGAAVLPLRHFSFFLAEYCVALRALGKDCSDEDKSGLEEDGSWRADYNCSRLRVLALVRRWVFVTKSSSWAYQWRYAYRARIPKLRPN